MERHTVSKRMKPYQPQGGAVVLEYFSISNCSLKTSNENVKHNKFTKINLKTN